MQAHVWGRKAGHIRQAGIMHGGTKRQAGRQAHNKGNVCLFTVGDKVWRREQNGNRKVCVLQVRRKEGNTERK